VLLLIVLTIALTSLGILVVMAVALLRHVKLLSASVGDFRDQVRPVLEEIREASLNAQGRVEGMSRRASERERERWRAGERGASGPSLG
jgi:hypothetical protein